MATPLNYEPLRRVGATGRHMLVMRPRRAWNVPRPTCRTESGVVYHDASDRRASYGALAAQAASVPVPEPRQRHAEGSEGLQDHRPADPRRGQCQDRHRATAVRHRYDRARHAVCRVPEMPGVRRQGRQRQCRRGEGTARRARRLHRARKRRQRRSQPRRLADGVAIVADSWWAANKARQQLRSPGTKARPPRKAARASPTAAAKLARARRPPWLRRDGDAAGALKGAAQVVEAAYAYPFLSHIAAGAAELHGACRGRQGRDLGADAESRHPARAWSPRRSASIRTRRHRAHDPRRRRLRPAAAATTTWSRRPGSPSRSARR